MHTLLHGDTLQLLTDPNGLRGPDGKLLKADACITDPPYNVSLDGDRDWDDFQKDGLSKADDDFMQWTKKWARPLAAEVLKPMALMAAFSAHRTIHAVVFGLQHAGYDIIDMATWLYATGQVKHKAKLKAAYEPIAIARRRDPQGNALKDLNKAFTQHGRGLLHTQEIKAEDGRHPMNIVYIDAQVVECDDDIRDFSKFAYVAKPSRDERDYGCDALAMRKIEGGLAGNMGKSSIESRNIHPTVKPIELMRRVVRMLTKPGATVIDPFMGSGTTGIACMLEGRNFIGIEREAEFYEIATHRIRQAEIDAAAATEKAAA